MILQLTDAEVARLEDALFGAKARRIYQRRPDLANELTNLIITVRQQMTAHYEEEAACRMTH